MFAKTIIDSDAFLDMPASTQNLYFHLAMRADDDGFVNNPKRIQRMVGANDDDAKLLIAKRYILIFDSGVIVIKHWKIHNYIRNDRYKPTTYVEELATLKLDEKNAYTEKDAGIPLGIPNGYQMDTQDRIGKDRIGKDRIGKDRIEMAKTKRFAKPTLNEIESYISEKGYTVNAQRFLDYYDSNGWKVGKNPMKDWKAAVRSWQSREKKNEDIDNTYDIEEIERKAMFSDGEI